jgi:hypothetical protein
MNLPWYVFPSRKLALLFGGDTHVFHNNVDAVSEIDLPVPARCSAQSYRRCIDHLASEGPRVPSTGTVTAIIADPLIRSCDLQLPRRTPIPNSRICPTQPPPVSKRKPGEKCQTWLLASPATHKLTIYLCLILDYIHIHVTWT